MTIRLIYCGSPEFAVPSLRALAADPEIDVTLVVSQPDRPAGRGRQVASPPVASFAAELGLPVFQPAGLKDDSSVDVLMAAQPDVIVVVAYGEILRRNVLHLAPHGALNVHPSLLPRYRGASPIASAILAGDATTGTTIMRMVRRLDAGPIVAQRTLDITPDDTTATLGVRLAEQAAEMLPSVVRGWIAGELPAVDQDEAGATYTREWTRDDARVDWSDSSAHIERLVRAASPWPLAWTTINGAPISLHLAHVAPTTVLGDAPGTLTVDRQHVYVSTGDGALELMQVQPAGKRLMSAAGWLRGLRQQHLRLGA